MGACGAGVRIPHAYGRTVIVIVIVIGGLKSMGLTKPHIVGTKKIPPMGNPDYPWTIDAKGCPKASNRISKFQIGLIWGFSYIQTDKL